MVCFLIFFIFVGVYNLGTRAYIYHTPSLFYLCFSFKMLSYSGLACRYVQKNNWDKDCIDWARRMHRRHTVQGCDMKVIKGSVRFITSLRVADFCASRQDKRTRITAYLRYAADID